MGYASNILLHWDTPGMHGQACVIMIVADALVSNKHQGISKNHADSTAFLSAYELYYAFWTASLPLNKQRSRAVWKLRIHHFLLVSVGSSSHNKNAPVNMMVCAVCLSIFYGCHLLFSEAWLSLISLWRTQLRSWQTANYPHQNYTLDTSFIYFIIHVYGSHSKPHLI